VRYESRKDGKVVSLGREFGISRDHESPEASLLSKYQSSIYKKHGACILNVY
jgi:hypothetical protein